MNCLKINVLDQEQLQCFSSGDEEENGERPCDDQEVEGLISFNRQVWTQDRSRGAAGRQPQANGFNGHQGFSRGQHPESQKPAFEVFFEDLIDCAVRFINLYGRRLAQAKKL